MSSRNEPWARRTRSRRAPAPRCASSERQTHQEHLHQLVQELREVVADTVTVAGERFVVGGGMVALVVSRSGRDVGGYHTVHLGRARRISLVSCFTNSSLFVTFSPILKRFSKPMVEDGLPESPAPHTLPA